MASGTLYDRVGEATGLAPDRIRRLNGARGESLARVAYEAYGDVAQWRRIAERNGITNPFAFSEDAGLDVEGGAFRWLPEGEDVTEDAGFTFEVDRYDATEPTGQFLLTAVEVTGTDGSAGEVATLLADLADYDLAPSSEQLSALSEGEVYYLLGLRGRSEQAAIMQPFVIPAATLDSAAEVPVALRTPGGQVVEGGITPDSVFLALAYVESEVCIAGRDGQDVRLDALLIPTVTTQEGRG